MLERSVLVVQNITREGPGVIKEILDKHEIPYDLVDLSSGQEFTSRQNYGAVVVMGGPDSANDQTEKMQSELTRIRECLNNNIPYMGICLGMQTLVKAAGGEVVKSPVKEVGFIDPDGQPFKVTLTEAGRQDELFEGLGDELPVFHLHGETVELADAVTLLATGDQVKNQIVKVGLKAYGIQSHFELTEAMLNRWIAKDPDLKDLKPEDLRQEFQKIEDQYTLTAWQLFTNFLTIAGLI